MGSGGFGPRLETIDPGDLEVTGAGGTGDGDTQDRAVPQRGGPLAAGCSIRVRA